MHDFSRVVFSNCSSELVYFFFFFFSLNKALRLAKVSHNTYGSIYRRFSTSIYSLLFYQAWLDV